MLIIKPNRPTAHNSQQNKFKISDLLKTRFKNLENEINIIGEAVARQRYDATEKRKRG